MSEANGGDTKVRAENVAVAYTEAGRSVTALSGVNLTVRAGEFVAIVGPSGCGKSTFLMALDGLLPLAEGAIYIEGRRTERPGRDRAVVFQDASLLPWRSVADNILYGLELGQRRNRKQKAASKEIARRLIDIVGLSGFEDAYPRQLSGGMQQRVNLARALAVNPSVLLLDEPFASLDAQTRELMQDELLRVWSTQRTTAIFVTHQIDEAIYLSDRVLVFGARPGRVVLEVPVPLPRPRQPALKQTAEFAALEGRIWEVIRGQLATTDYGERPGEPMPLRVGEAAQETGIQQEGNQAVYDGRALPSPSRQV